MRYKLNRRSSKKMFAKGAKGAHPRNFAPNPMRGGYRI